MGCNYVSIPILQWRSHWSLGADKLFHPAHNWACGYLSMLGLRLNRVNRSAHRLVMYLGPDSIKRCRLISIGNPIVEIRRSYDRLISTMGFPILVRWHLYIESGPWSLYVIIRKSFGKAFCACHESHRICRRTICIQMVPGHEICLLTRYALDWFEETKQMLKERLSNSFS